MARRALAKGSCRVIKTSAGKRKICRLKNGKVRFAPLSGTSRRKRPARKRRATRRR